MQIFEQVRLNSGFVDSALVKGSIVTTASIPVTLVVPSIIDSLRELIPMNTALFLH